jgi:hypothetical protein
MAKSDGRRFGLIVIGDEILSGRRQDKHLAKMIELLSERESKLGHVRPWRLACLHGFPG